MVNSQNPPSKKEGAKQFYLGIPDAQVCSFCGRPDAVVEYMFVAPSGAAMCNKCVREIKALMVRSEQEKSNGQSPAA